MKLVHWLVMIDAWVGCYIWYNEEGPIQTPVPSSLYQT